jgi:hypothetical protein
MSSPEEQKRSGGAGIYFHTSYLVPHEYVAEHNPSVLLYDELTKAYKTGLTIIGWSMLEI